MARLGRGYKIDNYGFTSVNTHCPLNTNEPFVLASQSEQVFYLKDMVNKDWLVVVKTNPRDLFNIPEVEEAIMNDEAYQQEEVECNILFPNDHEPDIHVSLYRDDVEQQTVCVPMITKMRKIISLMTIIQMYLGVKKPRKSYYMMMMEKTVMNTFND